MSTMEISDIQGIRPELVPVVADTASLNSLRMLFAAQAEGEGNTNSDTLIVNLEFKCVGVSESLTDPYTVVFEYNTVLDSLTDSFRFDWKRTQ